MDLSRKAGYASWYEIAFYALAAAMHAARQIEDDARLIDVATTASELQILIDDHAPGHIMASRRGRTGYFGVLHHLAFQYHQLVQYKRFRSGRHERNATT